MKKEIKVTKEQLERLIEQAHNQKYGAKLKESTGEMSEGYFTQGSVSNPGVGSAEGIIELIKMAKAAWSKATDPKVKEAIKNFLASLGSATKPGIHYESKQRIKPIINDQKPVHKLVKKPSMKK